MKLDHGFNGQGVIFREALDLGSAICMPAPAQHVVLAGKGGDVPQERAPALGPRHPLRAVHQATCFGEPRHGQRRPSGQDLVVESGLRTPRSRAVPPVGHPLQGLGHASLLGLVCPKSVVLDGGAHEDVLALFPKTPSIHVKHLNHFLARFLVGERRLQIGHAPHVIRPFRTVAVRVEGRPKSPAWVVQFAQQKSHDPLRGLNQRRVGCAPPRFGIGPQQQAVVVEHFFKVGHVPPFVDAVAGEPSSDVVVNATACHGAQRQQGVIAQRVSPLGRPAKRPFARRAFRHPPCIRQPKPALDLAGEGKLRGASSAAVFGVPSCAPARQPFHQMPIDLLLNGVSVGLGDVYKRCAGFGAL